VGKNGGQERREGKGNKMGRRIGKVKRKKTGIKGIDKFKLWQKVKKHF
jgi:hypothetical protein